MPTGKASSVIGGPPVVVFQSKRRCTRLEIVVALVTGPRDLIELVRNAVASVGMLRRTVSTIKPRNLILQLVHGVKITNRTKMPCKTREYRTVRPGSSKLHEGLKLFEVSSVPSVPAEPSV